MKAGPGINNTFTERTHPAVGVVHVQMFTGHMMALFQHLFFRNPPPDSCRTQQNIQTQLFLYTEEKFYRLSLEKKFMCKL